MDKTTPAKPQLKKPSKKKDLDQAATAAQNGTPSKPSLNPEQVRKDLTAMLQRAAKAASAKKAG